MLFLLPQTELIYWSAAHLRSGSYLVAYVLSLLVRETEPSLLLCWLVEDLALPIDFVGIQSPLRLAILQSSCYLLVPL